MGLSTILTTGVPLVIKLVERLFGSGGGKETKMPAAQKIVQALISIFAGPGIGLPGAHEIADVIQQSVDALNKAGELKGSSTNIDASGIDVQLLSIGQDLIANGTELIQRSITNKGAVHVKTS
jgi:hypothetical protein